MAGQLDFLTSEDAQLGLALLAAAGPQATPMSFGQRLAGGMQQAAQTATAREDRKIKNLLLQAQLAQANTETAQKQAQMAALGGLFGPEGGGPAALPQAGLLAPEGTPAGPVAMAGPPGAGGGAAVAQAAPTGRAPGSLRGVPLGRITQLRAAGGPDLTKQWELENIGTAMQPGYRVMADGSERYMGDPTKGRTVTNGEVGFMPGYLPSVAAETATIEGIKSREGARYAPGEAVYDENGRKVLPSRLQQFGGGAAAPSAAPAAPGRPIIATPGSYAGGSRAAADGGRREVLTTELDKATSAAATARQSGDTAALERAMGDVKAVQSELARLPGGARVPAAPLIGPGAGAARAPANVVELSAAEQAQNAADKAAAIKLAEGRAGAQVARETSTAATGRQFSQMTTAADLADKLLDAGPTGSGAGALADRVGNFIGQPLKGASQAAQLKALGGWLVANVPRMEGPQSDRDVANYAVMAGQVGDDTLPASTRKEALRTVMQLQKRYAAINGVPSSDDAAPPAAPLIAAPARTREFKGTVGAPGSAAPAVPIDDLVKKYAR